MSLLLALAGAVSGAIVGSFLATLCLRWPRGEQVVSGRSRCDGCGRTLAVRELVPVLSWVAARGQCHSCHAPIARLHLAVELTAAGLAALALFLAPDLQGLAVGLFWLQLLTLAVLDLRHLWLPDRLTFFLAATGLIAGGVVSDAGLLDRLIGGLGGFASLWLIGHIYQRVRGRRGLGGGDPKLLAAIGVWVGWTALPSVLLVASLLGLCAAILMRLKPSSAVPFGTLLAAGAVCVTLADLIVHTAT